MEIDIMVDFEDYFPSMMVRLGAEGFIGELCNGFRLLMDCERGLITFESLKRNSVIVGLNDMGDDEIVCMLSEGTWMEMGHWTRLNFVFSCLG
ncbi:putative B-box type zinc finger family protein [Hibiscus syriacus]|uniref:B-box type zinc finger family protein n=1 Tax=Hibiscus syriacus TaxID=106335 RepID=A0A6A2Y817_HIBSY|nr:putative B-box type zinc finger family protein [Hibiscus syriacus]